jgi:predicted nucleotidyltransferase
MASTLDILRRLVEHQVDFVLVGGMAATVHGSTIVTEDVDVCTRFELDNLQRLIGALAGLHPRQRMTPARPALPTDPSSLLGLKNLYLITDAGQVDFLGAVTGVGGFQDVARGALALDLGGFECRVMGLEDLIKAKRTLGRDKDLRAAVELERVLQRVRK